MRNKNERYESLTSKYDQNIVNVMTKMNTDLTSPENRNSVEAWGFDIQNLSKIAAHFLLPHLSDNPKNELSVISFDSKEAMEFIALKAIFPKTKISYVGIHSDENTIEAMKTLYKNFPEAHFFQSSSTDVEKIGQHLKANSLLPKDGFKLVVSRHPDLLVENNNIMTLFTESIPYFSSANGLVLASLDKQINAMMVRHLIEVLPNYSLLNHKQVSINDSTAKKNPTFNLPQESIRDGYVSLLSCEGHPYQKSLIDGQSNLELEREFVSFKLSLIEATNLLDQKTLHQNNQRLPGVFTGMPGVGMFSLLQKNSPPKEDPFSASSLMLKYGISFDKKGDNKLNIEKLLRNIVAQSKADKATDLKNLLKACKDSIDINAQDPNPESKKTALHQAVIHCEKTNTVECFKILIEAKADQTIQDAKGKTAIDYIDEIKNLELKTLLFQWLKENTSSVAELLKKMVINGEIKKLDIFLTYNKDPLNIDIQDSDPKSKRTPLHHAVINCKTEQTLECFKLLIMNDADQTIQDAQGKTAIDYVDEIKDLKLKESLLQFVEEHNNNKSSLNL